MKDLFLKLLNSSISASWLVLAILLLRVLLKRMPRKLTCALWALVAVRLLCPISIESRLSLIPATEPIRQEALQQISGTFLEEIPTASVNPTGNTGEALFPISDASEVSASSADLLGVVSAVWVIGIAALAVYAVASGISMKKRLAASLCIRDHVYSCDYIDSPFIFGITNPKIYLPSSLTDEELPYVLAHENAHLQRRDHLWKPLGFLILSIYWFHPVLWIAFRVFCRDMELACDEQVIKDLDVTGKAAYSRTLLHYSGSGIPAVGPLAFGEKDVKHRINSILRYQAPAAWVTGIGILASIVLAVCFLTNPVQATEFDKENSTDSSLLENVELTLPDSITRESVSDTRDYFYEDGQIVGGIELLDIASLDATDLQTFIDQALAVMKSVNDTDYDYIAESSNFCLAGVSTVSRDGREFYHYFFGGTQMGYDIWMDNAVLDSRAMINCLKTLHAEDLYIPEGSITVNEGTPLLNLRFTLPDGITQRPTLTTRILFYSGGTLAGGVEQINASLEPDALGQAAEDLAGELYGEEFDNRLTLRKSDTKMIAGVYTDSETTHLVHYIIDVGDERYDVWADIDVIPLKDALAIAQSCQY